MHLFPKLTSAGLTSWSRVGAALCALAIGLGVAAARAQVADDATGVSVTIKVFNLNWDNDSTDHLDLSINGLNGLQSKEAFNTDSAAGQIVARLAVGKTYTLNLSGFGLNGLTLLAVPPPGYVMEIDGAAREQLTFGYTPGSVRLRVRPPAGPAPGRAGVATALGTERTLWQVSLGALSNGGSAGAISFIDVGAASTVASIFKPEGLIYDPPS